MSFENAVKALRRAKAQYDKAATHAWEPAEPSDAVMWAFYAYENAIIAVAELKDISWEKNHAKKAALARGLHAGGTLRKTLANDFENLTSCAKMLRTTKPARNWLGSTSRT